jgi:hypothetical protein
VNKKEYARVSILLHKKSNNKTLKIKKFSGIIERLRVPQT